MIRKILYSISFLLALILFGFFFVAGKIIDGQNNVLLHPERDSISESLRQYHNNLIVADLHADNLLWDRNPLVRLDHGHVDIPRLIEGNFTLQVFDAVIKTPRGINYEKNTGDTDNITFLSMANRWPVKSWFSLTNRALYQSKKLHQAAERSKGSLRIIRSPEDVEKLLMSRDSSKNLVGGLLAIEGLHALEGKIENLQVLYDAGFRIMGLTHFFDNEIGGSSAGVEKGGLTEFGRQVIAKMNELGIIIDLAHASPALIQDVLEVSQKPVLVSHTGIKAIHNSPRNLSNEQLLAIREKGGIIGIGFWDGALGEDVSPDAIARAIQYTGDLIGYEHVALGSDWDGATSCHFDAASIHLLTAALIKRGLQTEQIALVMGRNQLNFIHENLN